MRIRTAIRKSIKWGGAALVVVLLVVWIGSLRWQLQTTNQKHLVIIEGASVFWWTGDSTMSAKTWGCSFGPTSQPARWWFSRWVSPGLFSEHIIPIWFPLLLVLIPTALAWRPDIIARLRSRRGACLKCGYARTGLAPAAVCPECGTAPAPAAAPAS